MRGFTPDISVVIPVRNGARTLPNLVRSLQAQSLSADRFEVVLVDNGSTDATSAIAKDAGILTVFEEAPNIAQARNRGVQAARADRFAFIDADCVASPRWLAALVDGCPISPLVAGEIVVTTRHVPSALERFETLWRFGQRHWVNQGWAATANLAVTRWAFETTGGFNPVWSHGAEDAEFCLRARRAGLHLTFCAEALVTHDADSDWDDFLRRSFRHGLWSSLAHYRLGVGHRAWRKPLAAVSGRRALAFHGQTGEGLPALEYQRMAAVARIHYAARIAGSLWAEAQRRRRS